MPSIPELINRFGDDTVELRAVSAWDIPEILIAHQDDPMMYRQLGLEKPPSGAQLGSQVEQAAAQREVGHSISFTIVEPGLDDCRGRIDVYEIDWNAASAQLGTWVAPDRRRRGYGSAALRLVAAWLAEQAGITTVTIRTQSGNTAMRAAATAAGFVETGDAGDQDGRVLLRRTAQPATEPAA